MALFGKNNEASAKKSGAAAPAKGAKKTASAPASSSMKDLYSEAAAAPKAGKKEASKLHARPARVLVRPLVTEKAANLAAAQQYVFVVSRQANKIEVAKAIQDAYGVKPVKVNLMNVPGKAVARGRIRGQRSDWRKAIVTLAKGQSIKVYEGV